MKAKTFVVVKGEELKTISDFNEKYEQYAVSYNILCRNMFLETPRWNIGRRIVKETKPQCSNCDTYQEKCRLVLIHQTLLTKL